MLSHGRQQVETLYRAAKERKAAERGRFLQEMCAGDDGLRQEVESRLQQDVVLPVCFDSPETVGYVPERTRSTSFPSLAPGTRIGVYEVVMLLGAGGMGQVYKARDTRLGRPVALKVLSETRGRDDHARRHIEREATAISRLNHPHICTLYDIGHHETIDYLVMEFLAGETIREQLDRDFFSTQNVARYGIQIAEALAEAHRCGLLHGDLKPGNVMITANGAKVLDFGLARSLDLTRPDVDIASASSVRIHPEAAGTLPYMAPEQLESQISDRRSDIFSYGALLYEMFSGRRPFDAPTETALVAAILRCQPAPLAAAGTGTQALRRVIRKCLLKEPDGRWQRFDDIVAALTPRKPAGRGQKRSRSPLRPVESIRRLVVLPFENRSPDTLEEYVSEGITDALTAAVSTIRPLRVISHQTSLRLDERHDLGAVARRLGVDCVIRGTMSGNAERVELRVELVQAPSGAVLWSELYDCPLDDVLRAQNDIAATMAMTLQLTLTPADRKRSKTAQWSLDRSANEAYLRGRYFLDRTTLESVRRSFHYLSSAVQKDPAHGRAQAALAEWYVAAAPFRLVARSEALLQSKAAALKAITLDPTLSEAHTCLGLIAILEWDLHRARQEFTQALQLNPNSANALRGLARSASWLGHHQEAIEQTDLFKQLDPVTPKTHVAAACIYYGAGDYEQAITASREALDLESHAEPAQYLSGMSHHFAGRSDAAIEILTRASAECPALLSGLAFVLAQHGRSEDAQRIVEEMKERATTQDVLSPYDFAEAFIGLADSDRALEYLHRASELCLPEMVALAVDPVFTSLHADPRFRRILRTVGLETALSSEEPPSLRQ
jgi:eukaryotic-like serine/threonine-protein kinase